MTHPDFESSGDSYERHPYNVVDRMDREDWPEFCRQAEYADALALDHPLGEEGTAQWVIDQVSELNQVLGEEYIKKYCRVFGLAYTEHHVRNPDELAQPVVVDTNSASLQGVDMQHINGKWVTLLQFHIAEHTDTLPHGMYYVRPRHEFLLELKVDLADDEDENEFTSEPDTAQLLAEQAEAAQNHIAHESFTELTPAEQRAILNDIIIEADNTIDPAECGHTVRVVGLCYYAEYDDMPGFDLADSFTDQRDLAPEDQLSVKGEIRGHTYPELGDIPHDKLLTPADFTFNAGAPCLLVRSDEDGRTYYLQPQHITDISQRL